MVKERAVLNDRLAELINAMGYEFVGLEWLGTLLRVYIDHAKGVTIDDCTKVSYQISGMLDVEDWMQTKYSLEVSSPGLDRPLFQLMHYQSQIGKRLSIRVMRPMANRRKFVGILLRVEENDIHLLVDAEEVVLPFSDIEKANVIAESSKKVR